MTDRISTDGRNEKIILPEVAGDDPVDHLAMFSICSWPPDQTEQPRQTYSEPCTWRYRIPEVEVTSGAAFTGPAVARLCPSAEQCIFLRKLDAFPQPG